MSGQGDFGSGPDFGIDEDTQRNIQAHAIVDEEWEAIRLFLYKIQLSWLICN